MKKTMLLIAALLLLAGGLARAATLDCEQLLGTWDVTLNDNTTMQWVIDTRGCIYNSAYNCTVYGTQQQSGQDDVTFQLVSMSFYNDRFLYYAGTAKPEMSSLNMHIFPNEAYTALTITKDDVGFGAVSAIKTGSVTPADAICTRPPDAEGPGTTTTTAVASNTGNNKIAVLITDWGTPSRYVFEYSWYNHYWARVGDPTDNATAACKIGHVGKAYTDPDTSRVVMQSGHLGLLPYALSWEYPGMEYLFDQYGFYKFEDGVYKSINPEVASIAPGDIPDTVDIIPANEVIDVMTGRLQYPPDPRDGSDPLAGWYKLIDNGNGETFKNGVCDTYELNNLTFIYYYTLQGLDVEPWLANDMDQVPFYFDNQYNATKALLEAEFGDAIDVRLGTYTAVPGHTEHEIEVTKAFADEGFRKMVISRETTDYNHYADDFMTENYVREALCEAGALDETEISQINQIGRTPEFNAMNLKLVKPYIEAYPEGSTIAMIYVTHGLSWPGKESYGAMGVQHPWWKEVIHENGFLNYLSWKKAVQKEYGSRYNLIFSKDGSDLLEKSFFAYGYMPPEKLDGKFFIIRDCINWAKEAGATNMIIVPCHWYGDAQDTQVIMRMNSGLKLVPKADMAQGKFDVTYCESDNGTELENCDETYAAKITITPSYNDLTDDWAKVYSVVLRGGIEKFGVFPKDERVRIVNQKLVMKKDGGEVAVRNPLSPVFRASITIPEDPHPGWPESFASDNATPFRDPADSFDCLWEDTSISVGWRVNPPKMTTARPVGPAVFFGPYRTIFNRDVTITIPYRILAALNKSKVKPYIYNHVTDEWEALEPEKVERGLVTFKTDVLGLFRAGVE